MALTPEDRLKVSARFQRQLSALPPGPTKEPVSVTKYDILEAVESIDAWVDANAESFNSAIPDAVRTTFEPEQKARLFFWVVRARFDPEDE